MKNVPTFEEFLNEGKVSDAIMTAIETWYNSKSDKDKKESIHTLSKLIALKDDEIEKILKSETDSIDAMEKLMDASE